MRNEVNKPIEKCAKYTKRQFTKELGRPHKRMQYLPQPYSQRGKLNHRKTHFFPN